MLERCWRGAGEELERCFDEINHFRRIKHNIRFHGVRVRPFLYNAQPHIYDAIPCEADAILRRSTELLPKNTLIILMQISQNKSSAHTML